MNQSADDHPDLTASGWQQRYDSDQTGWDRGATSPALLRWLDEDKLPSGSVLVPGCGRGYEVIELASRGFQVTGIDFAETPIQALKRQLAERHLSAELIRDNVLEFDTADPFDAVYEQTCLCAIAPESRDRYERMLAACLKPSGKLFALLMQSNQWNCPPYHCGYDEMRELFSDKRWAWSEEQFEIEHPSGLVELAVVLKKI